MIKELKSNDKREENLEKLLSGVATSDNLKFTHSIVEAILNRSESISEKLTTLANKSDIDDLNTDTKHKAQILKLHQRLQMQAESKCF